MARNKKRKSLVVSSSEEEEELPPETPAKRRQRHGYPSPITPSQGARDKLPGRVREIEHRGGKATMEARLKEEELSEKPDTKELGPANRLEKTLRGVLTSLDQLMQPALAETQRLRTENAQYTTRIGGLCSELDTKNARISELEQTIKRERFLAEEDNAKHLAQTTQLSDELARKTKKIAQLKSTIRKEGCFDPDENIRNEQRAEDLAWELEEKNARIMALEHQIRKSKLQGVCVG